MKRKVLIGVLACAAAAAMLPMVSIAASMGLDPVALVSSLMDPANLAMAVAAGGMLCVGDIQLVRSKELRQQRASLVEENGKVLARIEAEKDQARVKELEAEWDKRDADIEALTKQIERAERQEQLEVDSATPVRDRRSGRQDGREPSADEQREQQEQYKRYLWNALRYGLENLTPEARNIVRSGFQTIDQRDQVIALEKRDGLSTTNASGGYTIPALFFNELQNSLLAFGGAREMSTVYTTAGGQTLPIPTVNDTANEAQIVGEGSALSSPQDATFGVVNVPTFMYRSLLPITLELMMDSAFNMEAWIKEALTTRVARGTNRHFTVGNGVTQPKGFIPASSSGVTFSSATNLAYGDLVDLEHSVDPAYRKGSKVGFQFNDGTLKVLKKMKDSQNRPIWLAGAAVREPDTILGYRYGINQHMADVAASNKSMAFGDWSKFMVRDVSQLLIVRANEKFIDQGMIGFYVFSRHGSNIIDAGTDPIKHGTHPSPD